MIDSNAVDTKSETLSRRAITYKFLVECYRDPADHDFDFVEEMDPDTLLHVDGHEFKASLPEDTEPLRLDYSRLFVGPFEVLAVPYESVYLDDDERLMTESTVDVARRYEEDGLEIGVSGPPDHITAELEFMYYLSVQEAHARRENDKERSDIYRKRQRTFLRDHLSRWIEAFAEKVEEHAETDLYTMLGKVTREFVLEDVTRFIGTVQETK